MATKINVKNLPEGYQTILTNGKHSIIADEPISSKGTDLGLSPTELVLSGLAMCKVATVRFMARKNNWNIRDVNASLEQEVAKGENGLKTSVNVKITIEGDITNEQKDELIKQADRCYIHRLLNGDWDIKPATVSNNIENLEMQ